MTIQVVTTDMMKLAHARRIFASSWNRTRFSSSTAYTVCAGLVSTCSIQFVSTCFVLTAMWQSFAQQFTYSNSTTLLLNHIKWWNPNFLLRKLHRVWILARWCWLPQVSLLQTNGTKTMALSKLPELEAVLFNESHTLIMPFLKHHWPNGPVVLLRWRDGHLKWK
jgi:hypothetical protein